MTKRVFLACKVDEETHKAFSDWARVRGGVSTVLREMVVKALDDEGVKVPDLSDYGRRLHPEIRFKLEPEEAEKVHKMATERRMPASKFVKALVRAQCLRAPTFSVEEIGVWREVANAIRHVGAVLKGIKSASAVAAARELNGQAVKMIAEAIQGNLTYWGVDPTEKPQDNDQHDLAA
jgi:hypothetical protein